MPLPLVCASFSLVSAIFLPLGSETELGILGISVLADRMIVPTAAVSKKSSRTYTQTHTSAHTRHNRHVHMSNIHVNRKCLIQAQAFMLPSHMHSYTYSKTHKAAINCQARRALANLRQRLPHIHKDTQA